MKKSMVILGWCLGLCLMSYASVAFGQDDIYDHPAPHPTKNTTNENFMFNFYLGNESSAKYSLFEVGLGLKMYKTKYVYEMALLEGFFPFSEANFNQIMLGMGTYKRGKHTGREAAIHTGILWGGIYTEETTYNNGVTIVSSTLKPFSTPFISIKGSIYLYGSYADLGLYSEANLNLQMPYIAFGMFFGFGYMKK